MKKQKKPIPKDKKLSENLKKVIKQFFTGKGFQPSTVDELMSRLALPPQHRKITLLILKELIQEKAIEKCGDQYTSKIDAALIVSGVISVHPRGFGFLRTAPGSGFDQDIFVPKHLTQHAVDGDVVEVKVSLETVSEKGPEGRVISIIERTRTHVAGIIRAVNTDGDIAAYVPLLGDRKKVQVENEEDRPLRVGDRIIMEVSDWGTKDTDTVCRFSHLLGHISDPSCDIDAAIEEFELRSDFPLPVLSDAQAFGTKVLAKDMKNREDLRDVKSITIDPDTAKDFDDALTIQKKPNGEFHLRVHIADVSHYVQSDSPLDKEASLRCNSTYFPGFCLPMLPPSLSENLCSLKPNVNRLAVSVLMDFDKNGSLKSYRIVRSVIKSVKRFTYREAKAVLDGEKKSPHSKELELMVELCLLLKKHRYNRGSIEFALPELIIVVDENGVPKETLSSQYDITHQMVEEFMLKANEIVARHLSEQGKEVSYRVHEEPSKENMREFASIAGAFGFRLPDEPSAEELQELFEKALGTPHGPYLAISYIRSMQMAIYSPENVGHYGLSLTHYCHFTSPIRRYVDLVIHRLLFEEEKSQETIRAVSDRCSEQERISSRAETRVRLLKKLRYLKQLLDGDPHRNFEAVITKAVPFGVYFELEDLMLEGFLHVSELDEDYFVYEESFRRLKGRRTGIKYEPGRKIQVMVKGVDLIFLKAEWNLIGSTPQFQKTKRKSKKKRK